MAELVITAIGPDRPGLVDEFTGALLDAGGNVADSRMMHLRGEFAMMLLTEVDEGAIDAVSAALKQAGESIGLSVTITAQKTASSPASGVAFRLRVYGMDKPGIVHRITHLLHERGANIEELETHLEPGAYTGTPQFTMSLCMAVPGDVQVQALRGELQDLCDSINCDVDMEPV